MPNRHMLSAILFFSILNHTAEACNILRNIFNLKIAFLVHIDTNFLPFVRFITYKFLFLAKVININ